MSIRPAREMQRLNGYLPVSSAASRALRSWVEATALENWAVDAKALQNGRRLDSAAMGATIGKWKK